MEDTTKRPAADSDNGAQASYGKFKSAEELLKAYNLLQGEFTKRSQKLAEYERQKAEATDWEGKVADFVQSYPIAEKYADELAREIANNEKIAGKENCLESALLNVLSSKVKTTEEMAADESVIDRVLSAEENRDKIINQYLERIKRNASPTTLPKGGAIPVNPPLPARTIKEAGEIAIKIIETGE